MSSASEQYRPLLWDLLGFYPQLRDPRLRPGYHQVGHIAHGWYQRCHRGIEAVMTLDAEGYAEEAAPLRRSVLEHLIALRWLAAEGDAIIDTLKRGHARNAEVRRDAVRAAQWSSVDIESFDEVIAALVDADRSNDNLLQFKARSEKFGSITLLPGYYGDTARTHPSYESAMPYFDKQTGHALHEPQPSNLDQGAVCAQLLVLALAALNDIFEVPPWNDELQQVVDQMTLIDIAVRGERGMAIPDSYAD